MWRPVSLIVLVAVSLGGFGCAHDTDSDVLLTREVSLGDHGSTIEVHHDTRVRLALPEQRESPHDRWRLGTEPSPVVLRLVSDTYIRVPGSRGPGTREWIFDAVGTGATTLRLMRGSPGEAEDRFTVTIKVT